MEYTLAWQAYLLHLQRMRKSPATLKQYGIDGNQLMAFLKEEGITAFTKDNYIEHISLYCAHLHQKYPKSTSYNRKVACLRGFSQFAVLREWLNSQAFLQILAPVPKEKTPIKPLSEADIKQITAVWDRYLSYADSDEKYNLALRNQCIVASFLALGCKPAELVKMQWQHINNDAKSVRLFMRKGYRDVPCSNAYLQLMLDYETHLKKYSSSPYIWQSEANIAGEPITVKTVERVFQTISKEVGKDIRATDLRYSVIQRVVTADENPEDYIERFGYARKWVLTERQNRLQ